MRYNYWTLRYLPDPVRGEFVNIGVIVGRDGADWSIRSIESFDRASRLGGDLSTARTWVRSLRSTIVQVNRDCHLDIATVGASEDWIVRLRGFHNNCVQISDALPVVADSADEAMDLLFDRLIVEPRPQSRSTSHGRAVARLREAYQARFGSGVDLLNKVCVRSGRQTMDFDFALSDGSIQQLSKVWAFDLKDPSLQVDKVQAWGFRVEELRSSGGHLSIREQTLEVDSGVPVRVLYVPPRTANGNESLAVARDAWDRIEAQAFSVDDVERLVAV